MHVEYVRDIYMAALHPHGHPHGSKITQLLTTENAINIATADGVLNPSVVNFTMVGLSSDNDPVAMAMVSMTPARFTIHFISQYWSNATHPMSMFHSEMERLASLLGYPFMKLMSPPLLINEFLNEAKYVPFAADDGDVIIDKKTAFLLTQLIHA